MQKAICTKMDAEIQNFYTTKWLPAFFWINPVCYFATILLILLRNLADFTLTAKYCSLYHKTAVLCIFMNEK